MERSVPAGASATPWARWGEYAIAAFAVLLLMPALHTAAQWPFVHDAPVIRYIGFLMANGFAPYRNIIDMQMPGTYLADSLVVHTLGAGATAWLAWDLLNGTILTLACIWIAGEGRRLCGLIAGILACLAHLSDGPWFLGQRDWTVAMLMALSVGCLFRLVRGGRPAWAAGAFLLAGLSATIKPPALLLPAVLLAAICIHLKRMPNTHRTSTARLLLWALAGVLPPTLAVLFFLARWHALRDFLALLNGLLPYYASLHRPSLLALVGPARLTMLLLVLAGAYYFRNRSWRNFEMNLLLLASVCGVASYVMQGKGFPYHLYTAVTFLFLWVVLEMSPQAESAPHSSAARRPQPTSPALVVFVSLIGLLCLSVEGARAYPMNTLNNLESDLSQVGGPNLSHHVQCLDMTEASCLNVLYRMKLVQSTGTISDFYLFPDKPTPVTAALQNDFYEQVTTQPPRVFVLSSQMWPSEHYGYAWLANFPRFQDFLKDEYTLTREYRQDHKDIAGYRLYIHK